MRRRLVRRICCAVLATVTVACTGLTQLDEPIIEEVSITSLDLPGRLWDPFVPDIETGTEITITGTLSVPATDRAVPAVLITHGCGGVGAAEREWARDLLAAGIATLVLDSFTPRDVTEICSGRETVNVFDPMVDLFRAAELLDEHEYVDGSRLAVMGLSFGGRTALWSAMERFQDAYGGQPLQAYIAFYPSTCYIRLEAEHAVRGGPIRIFHGTADDWTPIEPCEELVERWRDQDIDADLFAYPDALHSFDNRSIGWSGSHFSAGAVSPRGCTFVEQNGEILDTDTGQVAGVNSRCVERGVSYGYDADARAQAYDELLSVLDAAFD